MACARFARVFRAACCRPPPFSACPSVLLDQPHMMARRFSERRPRSPAPAQHKKLLHTPDHTARPATSGRPATGWSSQFWPPAGAHPAQKRPRRRHRVPNHHFLPHASYEAFWSIFCYCSPTAQLLQSSSSVTDETNPSVAGRSPKFCASL